MVLTYDLSPLAGSQLGWAGASPQKYQGDDYTIVLLTHPKHALMMKQPSSPHGDSSQM